MKSHLFFSRIILFLVSILTLTVMSSCEDESDSPKEPQGPQMARQTVIMYMPWSGSGIYPYFLKNITSFEKAIEDNGGLGDNALVIFISDDENVSYLIKSCYENGKCERDTIKTYDFNSCDYTTPSGIATVINDAVGVSPAETYAMAVGSHGMGWIPVGVDVPVYSATPKTLPGNIHPTRYFGHSSNNRYQTNIETLADGIISTGIKMQYVLFDDCYMSNIETAYDLKDATDYLIASTCEIMIEGMPYAEIGIDLLNNNYKGVVDGFYGFYSTFSTPCGTIGVTDCREVAGMAYIMKQINGAYPDGLDVTDDVQRLDGYSPTIFFDFGDYVSHLCKDASLLAAFNEQLARLVPYKANTDTYYSMFTGRRTSIKSFSGLTISDPTVNRSVANYKVQTNWHKATH